MLQIVRIQNALIDAARAGTFHPVRFVSGKMQVDETKLLKPTQVLTHEIQSDFDTPRLNRQRYMRERREWLWLLDVAFADHATAEVFEERLASAPIVLDHDPDNGLRSVILEIVKTTYEHPPQQQPTSGTRLSMTLRANITPS